MLKNPKTIEDAEFLIEHRESFDSCTKAAKAIGASERSYRRWYTKAKEIINNKGYDVPDTQFVKGYSTLHKHHEDGSKTVAIEWVKTDVKKQQAYDALQDAITDLSSRVIPDLPITSPKTTIDDFATCYVLTDYHLGQLSWADEAGEDWDVEIATTLLEKWYAQAIQSAPASKVGVLAQLGDFLHWDGMDAVTPTSGHILDADSRFPKLVDLALKSLRSVVQMMLQKHEHVHVIMAEGNHDMASSVWLRAIFTVLFENEPRVTIDNTHLPYYCFEWGNTSLFFHHGHKKRMAQISEMFAGLYRETFGRTKYSYAHMGHLHHREVKENSLMVVEQHPTLAAKDAHSARGGYLSKLSANAITYSKNNGEISRITINPEMVM
jgi:hypothetical protein